MKKQLLILPIMALSAFLSFSQDENELPDFYQKNLYGFSLGLNINNVITESLTENQNTAKPYLQNVRNFVGINLGCFAELRLLSFLWFRPELALKFNEGVFVFEEDDTEFSNSFINSEISNFLVFKRAGNKLNPYFLAGLTHKYNFAADDNFAKIITEPIDYSFDFGIGLDFLAKFFIFSPELVYSYGLMNLNDIQSNDYSQSLKSINIHNIALTFYFKG